MKTSLKTRYRSIFAVTLITPLSLAIVQAAVADSPAPTISSQTANGESASRPSPVVKYRVTLANLHDGESVWNDNRELTLDIQVQPALAVGRGHRLIVDMDGKPATGELTDGQVVLKGIDRGAHEIQARIVNRRGATLATSDRITIYHRQHHLGTERREVR